jgi:hypothetical protein
VLKVETSKDEGSEQYRIENKKDFSETSPVDLRDDRFTD